MWYSFHDGAVWASSGALGLVVLAFLYKALVLALGRLNVRRVALPEIGWRIPLGLAGLWAALMLVRVGTGYLAAGQLRADAAALAGELISFADAQQSRVPSPKSGRWDAYTRELTQVSSDTQEEYRRRFAARVAFLRREFAKRRLTDQEMDSFYRDPRSPLAVRSVGERLAYMARQLQ